MIKARPTLNHDFRNSKQIDSTVAFSRQTPKSFVAASGAFAQVSANAPAFDSDIDTLMSKGLLFNGGMSEEVVLNSSGTDFAAEGTFIIEHNLIAGQPLFEINSYVFKSLGAGRLVLSYNAAQLRYSFNGAAVASEALAALNVATNKMRLMPSLSTMVSAHLMKIAYFPIFLTDRELQECAYIETGHAQYAPVVADAHYEMTSANIASKGLGVAHFLPKEELLVNLLLNNKLDGGTTPTGWTNSGAGGVQGTALSNGCYTRVFSPVASRDYIYSSFSASANTAYTVVVYASANTLINNQEAMFAVGIPAGASFSLRNPTSVVSDGFIFGDLITSATAGNLTLRIGAGCSSVTTGSVTLSQPAIFQGTLTAQQIIDAGGIPQTLATPNVIESKIPSVRHFQEYSGITPAFIGSPVGLVLDATRGVGSELAPALEAANWPVINADATHIVTWSGGTFRYQSDTTTPSLTVQKTGLLTVGKTYQVDVTVSSYTSGSLKSDSSASIIVGGAGKFSFTFQAIGISFNLYRNSANVDLTISSISVKEITGIHASQSTAANRPIVSKTPKTLGPELVVDGGFNNGLTNWTQNNGLGANGAITAIDGEVQLISTVGGYVGISQAIIQIGKTYVVQFNHRVVSGTGKFGLGAAEINFSGTGTASAVITATSASAFFISRQNTTAYNELYVDNVSVREVIDYNQPVTFFDGTNDFLTLSNNPIGTSKTQPYTVIFAGVCRDISAHRRAYGDIARMIGISANGEIVIWHDAVASKLSPVKIVAGQPFVAEVTWDGAQVNMYLDGVNVLSNAALVAPTSIPVTAQIGQNGANAQYWKGDLAGVVALPYVASKAERNMHALNLANKLGIASQYSLNGLPTDGTPTLSFDFRDTLNESLSVDFLSNEYSVYDTTAIGGTYTIWS